MDRVTVIVELCALGINPGLVLDELSTMLVHALPSFLTTSLP